MPGDISRTYDGPPDGRLPTWLFGFYKKERERAERCLSDIVELVNRGDKPEVIVDEIEGRIMAYYGREDDKRK